MSEEIISRPSADPGTNTKFIVSPPTFLTLSLLVPAETRLLRLPLSRVRNIMKLDQEVSIIPLDSVFLVAKATELFIESLIKQSYNEMVHTKKKTIQKKEVLGVIQSSDSLIFLEDTNVFENKWNAQL